MLNLMKKSFFIFTLSLFFVACGGSNTPESVAEKFFDSLYKGEVDISQIYLGEEANQPGIKELAEGKIKQAAAKAKAMADKKGGIKSIKVIDKTIEGNKAKVKLEITFKDDTKDTENAKLYNDNDNWRITLK